MIRRSNKDSASNVAQQLPKPVKDLKDKILTEELRQAKFDELKRHLFQCGVYVALAGYVVLVGLLCFIVWGYVYSFLYANKSLPSNFWHLPLMVCLIATTTLYLTLKLSSSFGKEDSGTSDKNYLFSEVDANDIPAVTILDECCGVIKSNSKKIKDIILRKSEV